MDLRARSHRGRVSGPAHDGHLGSDRDAHLRSADFLDVENHPKLVFSGRFTERTGGTTFQGDVDLHRIGFEATARIDRHEFGVSWQDEILGRGDLSP